MIKRILALSPLFLFSLSAFAEGAGDRGSIAIGAGLVLGLAALGGTFGQGRLGASAMEGIARNPQAAKPLFIPMILGLVFIESLVIFSFVMAILLQNKV